MNHFAESEKDFETMFGREDDEWEFQGESETMNRRFEESEMQLESMFGREECQFYRVISQIDLNQKGDIIVLVAEVNEYIYPGLKDKDAEDLMEGKAVDMLVFDEDTKISYKLKLQYDRPYFLLSDTTELYGNKGLTEGQKLGFRFEACFSTMVVKLLK